MPKKVTITDIANLVGVSKATISYYLNGNTHKMSLETREKIRQTIEATGYQPNKIARSLVTKDTKTIGVVIADITNPFISSVIKGITDTCTSKGYTVTFTNSDNQEEIEQENIARLKQQNVSGIIIDTVDANSPNISQLAFDKTVMVDRQAKKLRLDTVVSNNRESTVNFLREMKKAGYQEIYFVSFPIEGISTREMRYQGFMEEVTEDSSHLLILEEPGVEKRIYDLIQKAKDKIAFFTMNGPTLLAFMKIVNKTSFRYPEDFGLGSYEDLAWMDVLNPNVSCIRQDSYQIGVLAARHLLAKLKKEKSSSSPKLLVVPSESVIRNSF
ncbi:LacI family DNA-binding transcriptional regulator [Streptococcus oricebi]|uniref:LacI family transcriptional regulator n=1 Tax=Streptococcus oricebi TaxID=1547447 RepID=A0ABS5B4B6_9STRE|nr:LacI family DNA-binding transcriptional regulator [Streptococcus oricebi]MBP2623683.1 LacI family transcriptional regulator [Streptococcus oricebi]